MDLLNVRSFRKANIEFAPGINLLLGPNNAGKSTILKCLQKLQQGSLNKEDIRKTFDTAKIHIEVAEITSPYFSLLKVNAEKNPVWDNKEIVFGIYSRADKSEHQEKFLLDDDDDVLIKEDDILLVESTRRAAYGTEFTEFRGFSDMENENNFIFPFLSKRKTQYYATQGGFDAAYRVTDDLRNLPSKIQLLNNGSHPSSKEFIKHCIDILGFEIGTVPSSNSNEQKIGLVAKHGENIYLESMGEGVANILGLLAILLTEDNKLFLIEEIENDIHPEALKKLLNIITEKSKNNQFIISTHSNIVLKYLASSNGAKIFYIDSKIVTKDKVNIPTSKIEEIANTP